MAEKNSEGELHKIKNNKNPRVVKGKRGNGPRLKARRVHRMRKAAVSMSVLMVLCGGVFAYGMFSDVPDDPNVVEEGFVTVSYVPPTDGSTPDGHTGIENIGYMNYRLKQQTAWYSEMHGEVDTGFSFSDQQIGTYKQFSDGVLIQTEISTSGIVNTARQFCYVGDNVLWRLPAGGPSTWAKDYEGLSSMSWKTGDPEAHVTLENFIASRGLPGTDFSVYVLNEETILSADDVIVNAEAEQIVNASYKTNYGYSESNADFSVYHINEQTLIGATAVSANGNDTYTQTFYLDPAQDKAPCHYVNQMKATGGLPKLPTFEYITVTYTFDSEWRVLSSDVQEKYRATKAGIDAPCTATYHTVYEYGGGKEENTVYQDYFAAYAGRETTDNAFGGSYEATAVDCLAGAFGSVLTEKTAFDVQLKVGDKSIEGIVTVDVENMDIRAQFKDLTVWFDGETVYLAAGDNRFRFSVDDLTAFLPSGDAFDGISTDDLVASLATGEFTHDETQAALCATLDLLGMNIPLAFDFSLDENQMATLNSVAAQIEWGGITVDAALRFGNGSIPAIENKESFIDAVPYIQTAVDLFASDVIDVSVEYAQDGFSIGGAISVDLNNVIAAGNIALSYGDIQKEVSVIYKDGDIYLALDGLKIKTNAEQATAALTAVFGLDLPSFDGVDPSALIDKILSLDFANLFAVNEQNGVLHAVIAADELLKTFGIDFQTGAIDVGISQGNITANALGVALSAEKGTTFEANTEGYLDITPVLPDVVSIYNAKAIAFSGEFTLGAAEAEILLTAKNGRISWANGLEIYLDLCAQIQGTKQQIKLYASETVLKIVYGTVGLEIEYAQLGRLADAADGLAEYIRGIISQAVADSNASLDEDLETIEGILSSLDLGSALAGAASEWDIASLVNSLVIGESENGICTLAFEGLFAELFAGADNGTLALNLEYRSGDGAFVAEGGLAVAPPTGEMPVLPAETEYLDIDGICELLDTLGAAVATLAQQSYHVELSGTTKIVGETEDLLLYDINATIDYYSGGELPVLVERDEKNITVNTALYLHLSFAFANRASSNDSVYLEFYVLDCDEDDELDFFITLSRFLPENGGYQPLKLYASAEDLMTTLAAGVSLLGINSDLIDSYFVAKWLQAETVSQLNAIGSSLLGTFGLSDIISGFGGMLGGVAQAAETDEEPVLYYISSIRSDHESFAFVLDSSALYGKDLKNISFSATKTKTENGSYLTGVSLCNVYDPDGLRYTDVSLTVESGYNEEIPSLTSDYIDATGVGKLLKAIAASATHVTSDEVMTGEQSARYALNRNFYLDGSASLKLGSIGATIDIVAISVNVGEDGAVGVNIRLQHKATLLSKAAIKGSFTLDLTVKNGMVYMKQATDSGTVYRITSLQQFFTDILDHLGFMLNLSDSIRNLMVPSESAASAEVFDYGTAAQHYLTSYVYTPSADGDSWKVVLNGDYLTGGVLGDIAVTISADGNGILRELSVDSKLYSVLTLSATLTYENPAGETVESNGKTDETDDVSYLHEMFGAASETEDWASVKYYEAKEAKLTYAAEGETLGEQQVFYATSNGRVFTREQSPEIPEEAIKEGAMTARWAYPSAISGDTTVTLKNVYLISVQSEHPLEGLGFTYDEQTDRYVKEYLEGETLYLPVNGTVDGKYQVASFTDDAGNAYESVTDLTSALYLTANWKEPDFHIAFYSQDELLLEYTQTAAEFENPGVYDVYPDIPERAGYVFAGWAAEESVEDENTVLITVRAKFTPKQITLTLNSDIAFSTGYTTLRWASSGEDYTLPANGLYNPSQYVQFGWWMKENDTWTLVSDVTDLRYRDSLDGVEIWAAWINNDVTVNITTVKTSGIGTWVTWKIEGNYSGGCIAQGKSSEIYNTLSNVTVTGEGKYRLHDSEDISSLKQDSDWKDTIGSTFGAELPSGTFSKSGMTSGVAAFDSSVKYGGATVSFTYSYGDLSVTVSGSAVKQK